MLKAIRNFFIVEPAPITFNFDANHLAIAKPGDLVLLRLTEQLSDKARAALIKDLPAQMKFLAPGVKVTVLGPDLQALVLPAAKRQLPPMRNPTPQSPAEKDLAMEKITLLPGERLFLANGTLVTAGTHPLEHVMRSFGLNPNDFTHNEVGNGYAIRKPVAPTPDASNLCSASRLLTGSDSRRSQYLDKLLAAGETSLPRFLPPVPVLGVLAFLATAFVLARKARSPAR